MIVRPVVQYENVFSFILRLFSQSLLLCDHYILYVHKSTFVCLLSEESSLGIDHAEEMELLLENYYMQVVIDNLKPY